MSRTRPLFVDTNALVAVFNEDDEHHDRANAVLDGIGSGDLPYGPLFTWADKAEASSSASEASREGRSRHPPENRTSVGRPTPQHK